MGEDNDKNEPEKKRKKLHVDVPLMANNSLQSPDSRTYTIFQVDAAALQYQNQKLVQLLEAKKNDVHMLEAKLKELRQKQITYDETLINVNRLWNQLIDDLVLLESRLGEDPSVLQVLERVDSSRETIPSCPPEEMFLHRILGSKSAEAIDPNNVIRCVQKILDSRRLSTINLMKHFEGTINAQGVKMESLSSIINGKPSSEDALIQLHKIDNSLRERASNLRKAVDFLNLKHKQYTDEIKMHLDNHLRNQSEIHNLSAEVEESMAELEESRRKLINLKMQKDGVSRMQGSILNVANGSSSPDKPAEKIRGLRELKISIEETKMLAASRLSELQEIKEENETLVKQLEYIQDELKDEKYVISSEPYALLKDHVQFLNAEYEQYKQLIESLQADRNNVLLKEKELVAKLELADAAKAAYSSSSAHTRIKDLEIQLEKCTAERNDLEMKLEEALEDAGRKDIKDEIRLMASALSKEMEMMEAQLNRCKEAAYEAISLREEAKSLEALLEGKTTEHRSLLERCSKQVEQIKTLKASVEKLEAEKKELSIFLDMHGHEGVDDRTISEIEESEQRAKAQAEVLRTALDEHSLELRVRAAKEAEAACQERLSAAESEITELRSKLDASERDVLELTEAIRVKDAEADAYISEIEAIGQAYEDMQVQNQHLLQQVTDRDDCNIRLVSDSVRMKQVHSSLLAEKQAIVKQLQQVNASVEYFKNKISRGEDQMKALLSQALKASSENRHLAIIMDKAKQELVMAEKELEWLTSSVDLYEKEIKHNQQQISNMQANLESERNERRSLEEELAELKAEVDEMSTEKREAAIQKLQDEIKECKAILKCGVCFDRPKEVVITKCFHLFCSQCIQRNLEIRHRRCPGCGTAFGQNDVREVNI